MIEVYWPTGDLSRRQPYAEPLDLSQQDEVLLELVTRGLATQTKNDFLGIADRRPSYSKKRIQCLLLESLYDSGY